MQVTNIPAVLEKNEISPLLLFRVGLPGIGELTVYGAANGKAIELGVAGLFKEYIGSTTKSSYYFEKKILLIFWIRTF